MADPNWNRGFYYDGVPPHNGMKLARRTSIMRSYKRPRRINADCSEIATITYRSGPEWEQRFGRRMLSEQERDPDGHPGIPKLKPDFLIETYLDHQVRPFYLPAQCRIDFSGRAFLPHLRCQFNDLPLQSDGLVRHDRSGTHLSRREI
jgi:homoserine acetyltransferase